MAKTQNTQEQTLTQVRTYLNTLKLRKMEKALDEELSYGARENLPISKILERLLAIEADALIERRIERKIKDSRLPERKLLSDFDFTFQKSIDQHQIMDLATLSFVERKQGLILAGSSGTGKSHIAKACSSSDAPNSIAAATPPPPTCSGSPGLFGRWHLEQKLKLYTRPDILLIDEVGFDRLEQESARNASLFFKVIDQRYCKASTLLTTNIDFKALGDYLGDPVITTAIVDRLVHHSIIINIQGPSWRMNESKKLNASSKNKNTKTAQAA